MNIAVLANSFPVVSETFIVRRSQELGAYLIAAEFVKENTKYFEYDYDKVFSLGLNPKSSKTLLKRIKGRLTNVYTELWSDATRQKFEQLLTENKIDVVLAEFGKNGVHAYPSCKKLGIPLVIQFHGYDATSLLKCKLYKKEIVKAVTYSTKSVVVYSGMEAPLIQLGCEAEKFIPINVGVSTDDFTPVLSPNDGPFNFLSVGRLVHKKGPIYTLKAFELVADRNPNVFLNVVGDGPLMSAVKDHVQQSRHSEKIKVWGAQSQAEIKKMYAMTHAFLQHSVTASDGNKEGWPVGIAEACASGIPSVSTKHAGIVEQIIHGESGYLVDEFDVENMAKYMHELSINRELCKKMGVVAREHIVKTGDSQMQINRLRDCLASAVTTNH